MIRLNSITRENFNGFTLALLGTALLSTNLVTAKYCLAYFDLYTFTLFWTLLTSFYSLIAVIFAGTTAKLSIPKDSRWTIVLLGVSTGLIMTLSWAGLATIDSLFASFLWHFAPIFAILMSIIVVKEKLTNSEIACLIIMVTGGLVSAYGRWHIVGKGMILTLLACLISAIPMVIAKIKINLIPPSVLNFYRSSIGSLVILLWFFARPASAMGAPLSAPASAWAILIIGAFIGPTLSFLLLFKSYQYWDLSHSTIVMTAQPLFVFSLSYLFFGTLPALKELLGGILILSGAFWFIIVHLKDTK